MDSSPFCLHPVVSSWHLGGLSLQGNKERGWGGGIEEREGRKEGVKERGRRRGRIWVPSKGPTVPQFEDRAFNLLETSRIQSAASSHVQQFLKQLSNTAIKWSSEPLLSLSWSEIAFLSLSTLRIVRTKYDQTNCDDSSFGLALCLTVVPIEIDVLLMYMER